MSSNNPGQLPATYIKSLLSAMCFALIASTKGHAACVTPIEFPSDAISSQSWHDVLTAKAGKSLNSVISQVQDIDATGTGDVNLDFYALTFDSMGMSAEWWSGNFRAHLNQYVYGGTSYSVGPFDEKSKAVWESVSPVGAVLVFNLSELFGIPFQQGGVVVSCTDSTSFIFSTVSIQGTLNPGDHPVSGNRGFGFYQNSPASITFFTKGADRRKDDNWKFAAIGSQRIFELGAKVWTGLLDNLVSEMMMKGLNPRSRAAYRRQAIYPEADLTPPAAPVNVKIVYIRPDGSANGHAPSEASAIR